jgi:EAL domain-containing protein (putative c-di-GMP-specific phosphodiesterase class I)
MPLSATIECEALSHWIDPRYGFLSPGKFIPALEANREVYKVDCHALEGYGQDAEFLREKEKEIFDQPDIVNKRI